MNTSLKSAIIGCGAAIATFALISVVIPQDSCAAGIGGGEQYITINTSEYFNRGEATPAFDRELNTLGGQGWKVRATIGGTVILAK